MKHAVAGVLAAALITSAGLAQPQSQQPPVRTTTAGVLIDVTVVDSKGQPVLDLAPDDFELSEDGRRQQLVSATLVNAGVVRPITPSSPGVTTERGQSIASAAPAAPTQVTATPTVTAILFDPLSPEARPSSRLAALAYLSTLSSPNDYAGVFLVDLNLITFQPFTKDVQSLRRAIDRLVATAPVNIDAEHFKSRRASALDPNQPPTAGAESGSPGWVTAAERERRLAEMSPVERIMALMELRME